MKNVNPIDYFSAVNGKYHQLQMISIAFHLPLVFFTEADMIDGGRIGMKGEHSDFFSHSVSDCVFITGVSLECLIAFGN